MLTMDPPRHTALRALAIKGFKPRQVAKLNERITDMARDVVDSVIERGECDFVTDVAGALPSYVIAEMLGIPLEDGYRLYELTEIMNTGSIGGSRAIRAGAEMFRYSTELVARKRADPCDDIATSLLHAEVDGQRLTEREFNFLFLLLINAGGDTTRNLVAGGMCALMDNPEERAKLEADPSLLPTAVEEMLRYVTTFIAFFRTATKDTELRGVPVKEGDRVAMFYPSANRDEAYFVDPERFDVTRKPNPHLAFGGGGAHFCLGANLARVEAAALVSAVLRRMKNMELAGPIERMPSTLINNIHSMPVRFTPARRARSWVIRRDPSGVGTLSARSDRRRGPLRRRETPGDADRSSQCATPPSGTVNSPGGQRLADQSAHPLLVRRLGGENHTERDGFTIGTLLT